MSFRVGGTGGFSPKRGGSENLRWVDNKPQFSSHLAVHTVRGFVGRFSVFFSETVEIFLSSCHLGRERKFCVTSLSPRGDLVSLARTANR